MRVPHSVESFSNAEKCMPTSKSSHSTLPNYLIHPLQHPRISLTFRLLQRPVNMLHRLLGPSPSRHEGRIAWRGWGGAQRDPTAGPGCGAGGCMEAMGDPSRREFRASSRVAGQRLRWLHALLNVKQESRRKKRREKSDIPHELQHSTVDLRTPRCTFGRVEIPFSKNIASSHDRL